LTPQYLKQKKEPKKNGRCKKCGKKIKGEINKNGVPSLCLICKGEVNKENRIPYLVPVEIV